MSATSITTNDYFDEYKNLGGKKNKKEYSENLDIFFVNRRLHEDEPALTQNLSTPF